jgi:hypothetical protein
MRGDPLREALNAIAEVANYGAKKISEIDQSLVAPRIAGSNNAAVERFWLIARTAKEALAAQPPATPMFTEEALVGGIVDWCNEQTKPAAPLAEQDAPEPLIWREVRLGDHPGVHPVEKLWREHGLPEWFLGNGGTNTKLYALYDAILALLPNVERTPDAWQLLDKHGQWITMPGDWKLSENVQGYEYRPLYAVPPNVDRAAVVEECAKVADIHEFSARQAVRSAKGSRMRSLALGAEDAAQAIKTAIRALVDAKGAINPLDHEQTK